MNYLAREVEVVNPYDALDYLAVPALLHQVLRERRADGEHRLWFAVLGDAMNVRLGRAPAKKETRARAVAWFESESEETGSFYFVCAILRLEPTYILRLLAAEATREAGWISRTNATSGSTPEIPSPGNSSGGRDEPSSACSSGSSTAWAPSTSEIPTRQTP